jgi:WXG100 family type VII secretion target
MPAAIEVQPERLRHAAATTRALATHLRELRGSLDRGALGLDAALGGGEARSALAEFWTRWSGSAERLTTATDELAATLEAAAARYERADREGARTPVPGVPRGAGASGNEEGIHAAAR